MDNKISGLKSALDSKFGGNNFVQVAIEDLRDMAESETWDGFSADIPVLGGQEVQIVNPDPLLTFAPYLKGFLTGFIYLMTSLMVIKKLPTMLGS